MKVHQRGGEWWMRIEMTLDAEIKNLADEDLQEGGRGEGLQTTSTQ